MRTAFRLAILAPIVAVSASCASPAQLKAQSAGQIGCVPDAIEVSKPQSLTDGYMWNATCNGKKYLCTTLMSGQVSCALAAQ
jgi:hypothetical protein